MVDGGMVDGGVDRAIPAGPTVGGAARALASGFTATRDPSSAETSLSRR